MAEKMRQAWQQQQRRPVQSRQRVISLNRHRQQAARPVQQRLRRLRINGSRLVIMITLIYVIVTAVNQQWLLSDLHGQKALLEANIETVLTQTDRLEARREYMNSEAYVVQDARGRFGLVRPGEVLYLTRDQGE